MAIRNLINGAGESVGDGLITNKPLSLSSNIWYVNSVTGTDASGTAGQDREKPLATLAQAITNCSATDIIVLQSGHTETVTGALTLSTAGVIIVGSGTSGGKPAAQLKVNAAAADLIDVSGAGCEIRNVYFPAAVQSSAGTAKVNVTGAQVRIVGCYFELSALDQMPAVQVATGAGIQVTNSTFISTATTTTTRPTAALKSSGALSDFTINGCVFSDGTVGYSNIYGVDLSSAAITRIKVENTSLLLGAKWKNHASTIGWQSITVTTGGVGVVW